MNAWITELLTVAAALGFGAVAFLLARALYPAAFVQEVRDRRAQLLVESAEISRPPGRLRRLVRAVPLYLRIVIDAFMAAMSGFVTPLVRPAWAERMKRRFMAMGRPEYQPAVFRVRQVLFAVLFSLLGFLALRLLGRSWLATLLVTGALGVFGFFMPYIWLRDQIKNRHKAISRALPYHLDLLTLSLEAGLDFAQGLATVVDQGRPGPLLEELSILVSEMKLGKTREEGLRNMSDRVQHGEVTTFVSTLIQADKMGTSLGKVLRIQSGQMRVTRVQAAEKAANEAPVKMLVPLVLCFFPTMFMILFGPIIFRMMGGM